MSLQKTTMYVLVTRGPTRPVSLSSVYCNAACKHACVPYESWGSARRSRHAASKRGESFLYASMYVRSASLVRRFCLCTSALAKSCAIRLAL